MMSKKAVVSVLLTVFATFSNAESDENHVKNFLTYYGYVEENSQTDFKSVLVNFQERYNLPVDGMLNSETLKLFDRPRCSFGENQFRIMSKWNKTNLFWYFPQAQDVHIQVAEKAFKLWEENSILKFSRIKIPTRKPDITITGVRKSHYFRYNCQGTGKCAFKFDGVGKELAHAYFPQNDDCREIHFDLDENWYFGLDGNLPEHHTSFLMTLTHEIGHVIGLSHSDVETAIMFPWYQETIRPLDDDDKMALEALYGPKTIHTTTQLSSTETQTSTEKYTVPTTTETQTTLKSSTKPNIVTKHLCDVLSPDQMFLAYAPGFSNYYLYIIKGNLLWKININDGIINKAEKLSNYFPKSIRNVSHVFQNTANNLFVVSEDQFYLISFPNLNIQEDIQIDLVSNNINAVFQMFSGKTMVWFNNASFIEIDESDQYKIVNRGYVRDIFPGVPQDITMAFRYIDGNLYFLRQNIYYKFNEFSKKLLEAGPFNWKIFNIECPDNSLLDQLKLTLSKIIKLYE